MKKRIFSAFLAACLIMTLLPNFAMASESKFSDMPNDYSTAALEAAVENGLLNGFDGKIMPNSSLTRAQMATIIVRAFGAAKTADITAYTDVNNSEWYYSELQKAVYMGAFQGDNNRLNPDANITRQEAFVVVARVLSLADADTSALNKFSDRADIASWAAQKLAALVNSGYIQGSGDKLNPTASITRAEFAQVMHNIFKNYITVAGTYTSINPGNVIINTPGVTLKNMVIDGDLIIADGVGDGDIHLENVKIIGNSIVKGGGKNSLYYNNVTVGGALIVNKVGGDIRIIATGTTSVKVAVLESGAILVTKDLVGGGIEKIEIPATVAAGQNIVLDGKFNMVENNAANVTMSASGQINSLVLNESTTVTGSATIKNVVTAPGADSVVNGTSVAGGQNTAPKPTTPSGGDGGPTTPSASIAISAAAAPTQDGTDDPATNVGKYTVSKTSNTVTIALNQELVSFASADAMQGAAHWIGVLVTLDKDLTDSSYNTGSSWINFTQADIDEAVSCGATGTKTFVWWCKADTFAADKTMRLKASASADDTAVTLTVKLDKLSISAADFDIAGLAAGAYDGAAKSVEITAKAGKAVGAVSNIRYSGNTAAPVNVGTYAVSYDVAETASYKGATSLAAGNLVITQKALSSGIETIANQTYSGTALTPALAVKDGDTVLVPTTDYTAAYTNNINAGMAGVTVTFTGNYTGTATASFTIAPAPIASPITVAITAPAKGATPQAIIAPGAGWTGTSIIWYESGESDAHTGPFAQETIYTALIILAADGNHTFSEAPTINGTNGTVGDLVCTDASVAGNAVSFPVIYPATSAKDASTLTLTGITDNSLSKTYGDDAFHQTYSHTGSTGAVTFTSSDSTVATVDGNEITMHKAGTTTITATLAEDDNYASTTASYLLTVTTKPLGNSNIQAIPNQAYTGTALTPALTVKDGTTTLTLTTDYTAVYANNTNAGTAEVTVTFIGNYTGTAIASFTIGKAGGPAVTAPTVSGAPTETAITVSAVTLPGWDIEYAINTNNTSAPTSGWQAGTTFSGLTANTGYYVWARAKENSNYLAGPAISSAEIRTVPSAAGFTVTFDSNGGSSVAALTGVSSGSKITAPVAPTKSVDSQPLTFLGWYKDDGLTQEWDFASDTVTANITLYAKWSGWQELVEVDARFAPGYPKASVVDGKVQLKVKLTGATSENPMEVFMVVNQMNFHVKATTKAVIDGRTGNDKSYTMANEYPYSAITDESEHIISTVNSITTGRGVDVYFVVKDSTATSANPTVLTFEPAATAELATWAPYPISAYINVAMDTITLHFDNNLNDTSIPAASAFTLSAGTVSAVSIENVDNFGRVKLSVSGISDIADLTVSYTAPNENPLQDQATSPNTVNDFNYMSVSSSAISAGDIYVSHDGRYLRFQTVNALDWPAGSSYTATCKFGTSESSAAEITVPGFGFNQSWSWGGSEMTWAIDFGDSAPTPITDGKFFITLTPNSGAKDHAGDDVTGTVTFEGTPKAEDEASLAPTVTYNSSTAELTLSFGSDSGITMNSVGACYFTVVSGGVTYTLRGYTHFNSFDGTIVFRAEHFPFNPSIFNWSEATISYSTAEYDLNTYSQLNFESSKPYAGFSDVSITVSP